MKVITILASSFLGLATVASASNQSADIYKKGWIDFNKKTTCCAR